MGWVLEMQMVLADWIIGDDKNLICLINPPTAIFTNHETPVHSFIIASKFKLHGPAARYRFSENADRITS